MAQLRAMVLQVPLRHLTLLLGEDISSLAQPVLIARIKALLGQGGLDYADAHKKYKLRALPAENFSGLEAMCLMYAAFKRVAPERAVGMNLDEPFLTALEIFNHRAGKTQPEQE